MPFVRENIKKSAHMISSWRHCRQLKSLWEFHTELWFWVGQTQLLSAWISNKQRGRNKEESQQRTSCHYQHDKQCSWCCGYCCCCGCEQEPVFCSTTKHLPCPAAWVAGWQRLSQHQASWSAAFDPRGDSTSAWCHYRCTPDKKRKPNNDPFRCSQQVKCTSSFRNIIPTKSTGRVQELS